MKTALLLVGFNRPVYFKQVLTSLEQNPEAHTLDLFVYLDGGPQARQEELMAILQRSSLANLRIVCRQSNWGIGRNLIGARRDIFDRYQYDRLVLFEDDLVLSPTYISTVLKLSDWAHQYDNIGTVMGFNLNTDGRDKQRGDLDKVIATNRHFWGYCLTRRVWDHIKPVLYEYEERFLQGRSYRQRNDRKIRWQFIPYWMNQPRRQPKGPLLEVPESVIQPPYPRQRQWWKGITSQDGITALALWVGGYLRLTTLVPRGAYIGQKGFHAKPRSFKKHGFDRQQFIVFAKEDRALTGFTLLTHDEHGVALKPQIYK